MLKPIPKNYGIEGGALGRLLGPKCGALMNGIGSLIKEMLQISFIILPCEDRAKRQSSVNQEADSYQTLTVLVS